MSKFEHMTISKLQYYYHKHCIRKQVQAGLSLFYMNGSSQFKRCINPEYLMRGRKQNFSSKIWFPPRRSYQSKKFKELTTVHIRGLGAYWMALVSHPHRSSQRCFVVIFVRKLSNGANKTLRFSYHLSSCLRIVSQSQSFHARIGMWNRESNNKGIDDVQLYAGPLLGSDHEISNEATAIPRQRIHKYEAVKHATIEGLLADVFLCGPCRDVVSRMSQWTVNWE
jgi:hypothetical protein